MSRFLARRRCYSCGLECHQGNGDNKNRETRTRSEVWNGLGGWLKKSSPERMACGQGGDSSLKAQVRLDVWYLRTKPTCISVLISQILAL